MEREDSDRIGGVIGSSEDKGELGDSRQGGWCGGDAGVM